MHAAEEGLTEENWVPSQTLLSEVRKEKRTFRHVPANTHNTAQSLQNISALVSAPILDSAGRSGGSPVWRPSSGRQEFGLPGHQPF
ncbi:MAG: hypothetical protein CMJ72_13355 [Planctomycetaceae bacterium]|nr:hypothetical protein [Planctomycetaceae bacterium]